MLARIILRILLTCLLSKHMLLCMETTPNSLQAAIIHFANYENCHKFMVDLRWPDGKVTCPACGSEKVIWLAKTRQWKCYGKHSQAKFSLKTGTIFEDSPLPLSKWLPCAWLILNCKNGVSSYEIHRDLKVTQKTAWFMLSRLRLAMQDDLTGGTLNGEIEVDESFIGGKIRNMHKSRKRIVQRHGSRMGNKSVVFGMLERKSGKVRATVIPERKAASIQNEVLGHIEHGATIISDEFANSWEMPILGISHELANSSEMIVAPCSMCPRTSFWMEAALRSGITVARTLPLLRSSIPNTTLLLPMRLPWRWTIRLRDLCMLRIFPPMNDSSTSISPSSVPPVKLSCIARRTRCSMNQAVF